MAVYFCSRCGQNGRAENPTDFMRAHVALSAACEGFAAVHSEHVAVSLATGGYELRCPIVGCKWCNGGDPQMQDADRMHRSPGHQVHYSDAARRQLFDAHVEWHSMRGEFGRRPVSADVAAIEQAANRLCELLRGSGQNGLATAIEALVRRDAPKPVDAHA